MAGGGLELGTPALLRDWTLTVMARQIMGSAPSTCGAPSARVPNLVGAGHRGGGSDPKGEPAQSWNPQNNEM
jgi:hypothetical protein